MASFLPHVKTYFSSPNSNINSETHHNLQFPGGYGNVDSWKPLLSNGKMSSKCAKGESIGKIERKLEEQIGREEDLARVSSNCQQLSGGMVELLECLEREAIMGEDEGKDPMDYNRRAQIFDKSSTLFQALKEISETTSSNTTAL